MFNKRLWKILTITILFTGICLFLTFNRHSKSGYNNYHSVIWADKAGYYVYLPAAFKYQFNPDLFPDSIEMKTGYGFTLDNDHHSILTKYSYGVALLQLPFYLMADLTASNFHYATDGFSPPYHWFISIAAVVYLILGILFLFSVLKAATTGNTAFLALLFLFLATNLYYYSIDETGMSHIYSFFLFSVWLYLIQFKSFQENSRPWTLFLLGCTGGLILVTRPTNLVFLSSLFFWGCSGYTCILTRMKRFFMPRSLMPFVSGAMMLILPQLLYWKRSFGSFLVYSYGTEGFNWSRPAVFQTWFAPDNGLFLYSPFFLLLIVAAILMIKKEAVTATWLLLVFLLMSYIFSCWWAPAFGCSFGARNFVEYLAFFSLPLAQLFQRFKNLRWKHQLGFWLLVILLAGYNLKMTYSYDGCFYGKGTWDWEAYKQLVISPTK